MSGPFSRREKVRMRAGVAGRWSGRHLATSNAFSSAGPHPDPLQVGEGGALQQVLERLGRGFPIDSLIRLLAEFVVEPSSRLLVIDSNARGDCKNVFRYLDR